MDEFIELEGASGARYRFRLWPAGRHHPPIAGNYVCVRGEGRARRVLRVGETLDLSRLRDELPPQLSETSVLIFTRLNVSRAVRNVEHADLALSHPPQDERAQSAAQDGARRPVAQSKRLKGASGA